ncbi:MAG: hypothetical protein CVU50_03505 [Candidatus Cloacimonetes bacterium HGW-Cloacimonetes-3]|jgi:hypothetical protein|nr:MAG: hypothetical protein CVU50_03505 [Candidatus Cloacimonetes bacterium HGW-Cloacimonetes-3]
MNRKPTVFISSTIYDLKDLRSSLRWWFEKSGFRVLLSESNDFPVEPNASSYKACISAIQSTDVFVLLIGNRVGGMYDSSNRISITRQEYREARTVSENRNLQMIAFVRQELWTIKEDRKALEKYVISMIDSESLEEEAKSLIYHPSKIADEAEALFSFIDEVTQKKVMNDAIAGNASFPVNNWINPFSSFEDIVKTLETRLEMKSNLDSLIISHRLKRETIYNLKLLFYRKYDRTNSLGDLMSIRQKLPNDMDSHIMLNRDDCIILLMFLVESSRPAKCFRIDALSKSISEGIFLEWDSRTCSIIESELHEALLCIKKNIEEAIDMNDLTTKHIFEELLQEITNVVNKKVPYCSIEGFKLVSPVILSERYENLKLLLTYVFQRLSNISVSFDFEKLHTERNPFTEANARVVETQISDELLEDYISGEKNLDWFTKHYGKPALDKIVKLVKEQNPQS